MPDSSAERTSVLLVDDHALFRESVGRLLTSEPGFEVTALCGSIEEALAALQKARVDIVLLDFGKLDLDQVFFVVLDNVNQWRPFGHGDVFVVGGQ